MTAAIMDTMKLGFETCGHATLVCHDESPVLACDPWLSGRAHHGSWGLPGTIPRRTRAAIEQVKHVWISQDSEEHAHLPSLKALSGKKILLPDFFGNDLAGRLTGEGLDVTVMKCGEWHRLSDRIRVCSATDISQEAVLLIEMGQRILLFAGDSRLHGAGPALKERMSGYGMRFLLGGVADRHGLVRYRATAGHVVTPRMMTAKATGALVHRVCNYLDIDFFIPVASQWRFCRDDAMEASCLIPEPEAHYAGHSPEDGVVMPHGMIWDFDRKVMEVLRAEPREDPPSAPTEFGDRRKEPLSAAELSELERWVRSFDHLNDEFSFVGLRVGGKEHRVELAGGRGTRGVVFEAMRHSLMEAVRSGRFESLLLGNLVTAELHGRWPRRPGPETLFHDLVFFVCRLGERAGARSRDEIRACLEAHRGRGMLGRHLAPFDPHLHALMLPYLS